MRHISSLLPLSVTLSNLGYSRCQGTSTSTSTSTSPSPTASTAFPPLNDIAVAAGKQYFGVAVDTGELANATYAVNLNNTHLFGQMTPGNVMKWQYTEPSQNSFSFSAADALVNWALGLGKQVRGHTLVWHSQLPSWVTNGQFSNETLVSIVQNHITNEVSHFKGKLKTWDVANEIMNEDGTWRTSVFYNTIGEYFVDIAFRAAEAADPDVNLALNDYNLDYSGAKASAYQALITRLKSRGVKVDQIGSQSHLIVGSVPSASSLAANFRALAATGVTVAITELDIRFTLPTLSTASSSATSTATAQDEYQAALDKLLQQQRKDYNSVVLACMQVEECVGITIWAYSDYYSWIPSVFSGQGMALPWDDALQPKPAVNGILDALNGTTDS